MQQMNILYNTFDLSYAFRAFKKQMMALPP